MKRFILRAVLLVGTVAFLPSQLLASPIAIDFESFADGTALTNQIGGMTFTHATVLSAGNSLNEAEFPPHSGTNVVFDSGGELSIDFATPVSNVGGFFTYALFTPQLLRFTAFDSSHAILGVATQSSFSNNTALSGDVGSAPNEFLELLFSDIASVTIAGDPSGGSFVLDDLTFTRAGDVAVPEPATLTLLALGGAGLAAKKRRNSRRL